MTVKSFPKRTEKSVLDTDSTLIVSHGEIARGSKLKVSLAQIYGKPFLHLDFKIVPLVDAVKMLASWLGDNGSRILNRASKDLEIYGVTVSLLEAVLGKLEKFTSKYRPRKAGWNSYM